MARPRLTGLTYFPWDVNPDKKLERFYLLFEAKGRSFWSVMLEEIYREGWFLDVSVAETRHILAKKCYATLDEWDTMLKRALFEGLFDKDEYGQKTILTSNGIKSRFQQVAKKRAYSRSEEVSESETIVSEEESTQSKVKNSTVNKTPPTPSRGRARQPQVFVPDEKERKLFALYFYHHKGDTSSVEKTCKNIRMRLQQGKTIHGLALSVYRYVQHQRSEKVENKFWDKAANFFGEKATYERFYPEAITASDVKKVEEVFSSMSQPLPSSSSLSSAAAPPLEQKNV